MYQILHTYISKLTLGPNDDSLRIHSMVKSRVKTRLNAINTSMNTKGAPSNLSMSSRVFRMINNKMQFSNGPDVTSRQMWYLKFLADFCKNFPLIFFILS